VEIDYTREYLPFLPHAATLVVMYACVGVVVALFAWGYLRRLRAYSRGGRRLRDALSGRTLPWGPRLGRVLRDVVAQTKVRERLLPATLHLAIFYGTVLLFIGTTIVLVNEDVLRWFGDFRISGLFYVLFEAVLDLAAVALVVGVVVALWRRLVLRPEALTPKTSTLLVLLGLLFMGVSGLGLEAYRIAAQPNEWARAAFAGWTLSQLFEGWATGDGASVTFYQTLWWVHAAGAYALIVGAAWTGFAHVFVLPASVAARDPRRPRTKMTTPFNLIEAMESEEDVELVAGTTATTDIAPAERLSADACVACGRCHEECPAVAAGRPLSPRDLVQEIQRSLGTNLGNGATERPAAEFEDAVWSCTNCYACEQACPARIRHVDFVLDFRRALVDQNRIDEQKLAMLQALDRNQNPYKLPSHERAAWLVELPYADEILVGVDGDEPDWLFWIGCTAAYDAKASQAARATFDLLRAAGESFVTLGPAEPCCGEPAKRLGEEGRFQMIAMAAIEMIRESRVKRVVSHCPHCVNTIRHEYAALGLEIPVVHHSELLARLLAEDRLHEAAAGDGAPAVAYHEPCNVARAGHRAGAALAVLGADAGRSVLLPARSGERTFCCGGGGANMWYTVEQEERRISALRLEELAATGAARVTTACPFCLSMLNDATGSREGDPLEVVDIAEVLSERLLARDSAPL
jgi:Fe-S oxidoreductase